MQLEIISSLSEPLTRATPHSAGYDLKANIPSFLVLHPGDKVTIPTGVQLSPSSSEELNFVGLILPRSGLGTKFDIALANTAGVIDPDYQGEILLTLTSKAKTLSYCIEPGERIAQIIFLPTLHPTFIKVSEFTFKSFRATGGFGSTGKL